MECFSAVTDVVSVLHSAEATTIVELLHSHLEGMFREYAANDIQPVLDWLHEEGLL